MNLPVLFYGYIIYFVLLDFQVALTNTATQKPFTSSVLTHTFIPKPTSQTMEVHCLAQGHFDNVKELGLSHQPSSYWTSAVMLDLLSPRTQLCLAIK